MISRTTASFVHIYDVLTHIGFSDNSIDEILAIIGNDVSWGDATYTLINNAFTLELIQEAALSRHVEGDIPDETIAERFWEVVGKDDYINLETPF